MEMFALMVYLIFRAPFDLFVRLFTGDPDMPPKGRLWLVRWWNGMLVLLIALSASTAMAGGHQRLVRQSGITPRQVGTHEGVGMSTRGYDAAREKACYWGKRVPVSVQYSKRGPYYYAVVRYR